MISSDFPHNEKLSNVSLSARLLFIEMWIFADDWGVIKGNHIFLKNSCFPYDEISQDIFDSWVEELKKIGVIKKFEKQESSYYAIKDWSSHQKINRPSHEKRNPEAPKDIFTEGSLRAHGGLTEGSLTKEKEKIKEREREIEEKGGVGENIDDESEQPTLAPLVTPSGDLEVKKESVKTPAEIMRQFIAEYEHWQNTQELTGSLAVVHHRLTVERGHSPPIIKKEIKKFVLYWTEPTKSGKKQLWETKKTFEVFRRMATWFGNAEKYQRQEMVKANQYAATAHLYK